MSLIWAIIRHPLRALGALILLAALDGMFGAAPGAGRLLSIVLSLLVVATFVLVIATGIAMTLAGYGVQLWLAIGLAAVLIYLARHLRWQD